MFLVGVRPGKIIESGVWCQSNEGLYYKDIEPIYQCIETYHVLKIQFVNTWCYQEEEGVAA